MQRWLFQRELEKFSGQPVFYLDECGVDHRLYRESGRSPRGERIYEAVPGKRRERTRLISAARHGNGCVFCLWLHCGRYYSAYCEAVFLIQNPSDDYPLNLWQIQVLFRCQRFPRHRGIVPDFFAAARAIMKRPVGLWIGVSELIALATFPRNAGAAMPEFNPSPFGLRLNPFR